LNFSGQHDGFYRQYIDRGNRQYFTYFCHPVDTQQDGRNTLAWARIDLDPDTGEALIEELQNDWLREVERTYQRAKRWRQRKREKIVILGYDTDCPVTSETFCQYYEEYLIQHTKIWSETVLTATMQVLVDELSIRQIWMHTFETGNHLKGLTRDYRKPPVSLYEELPRKFCFQRTNRAPTFLKKSGTRKQRRWLESGKGTFWHHSL
ncbi:MAG: hypothetical protein MRY72_11900, partial [Aquisalinus sp.]|nr:hypothetical protein [Aquisalinus sp.]